jgi:prepilin signal peptidase PulO-like enzyme (type II secretory pathway)
MLIVAIYLFILGLCLGSFINALTWRLHEKKDWVKAHSQCPRCGHSLAAIDLIPVISWLTLRGRCRYCGQPISKQYPLVEFLAGLVFTGSYWFWPDSLAYNSQKILLITWLASSVGLIALLVYDLRWMLLPNKLIYPTLAIAAAGQFLYLIVYASDKPIFLLNWFFSVVIAAGLFFVLFLISEGRWIGFGDVRLGLITGTMLHFPSRSLLMIFLASILGLFFTLPSLVSGRRQLNARLPFGPFLIIATVICLLFGTSFINWYTSLLI